jgi:L-ornithine Nalpha-acyltransferase
MPATPLFARNRTGTQTPLPPSSKATFAPPAGYFDHPLAEQGDMSVRLATTAKEVAAVQALRYRIFYKNMGAQPNLAQRLRRRDKDIYDRQCAHLLLTTRQPVKGAPLATRLPGGETVIGCYRLLRRDVAEAQSGFYSAGEFQLDGFLNGVGRGLNIVELGRSCVAAEFRSGRAIALLWKGLGQLVTRWQVDALIGCASFAGTDVDAQAAPLSYLYHHHRADAAWQLQARDELYVEMNRMAQQELDEKAAKRALPPVLKGYLRSGALVGNGAVIDRQFNTVDVFVIMPMTHLADRYRARYAAE